MCTGRRARRAHQVAACSTAAMLRPGAPRLGSPAGNAGVQLLHWRAMTGLGMCNLSNGTLSATYYNAAATNDNNHALCSA
jgi:hypothetical protein